MRRIRWFLTVLVVSLIPFALWWVAYPQLKAIKLMHPAAFAAFFLAIVFLFISFLPTRPRRDLAVTSVSLGIASFGLASADNGCETAMMMFAAFTILFVLWAATAIYWTWLKDREDLVALLWRYGLPLFFVLFAIGMYFIIYPITR